jgi:hypothetical protein
MNLKHTLGCSFKIHAVLGFLDRRPDISQTLYDQYWAGHLGFFVRRCGELSDAFWVDRPGAQPNPSEHLHFCSCLLFRTAVKVIAPSKVSNLWNMHEHPPCGDIFPERETSGFPQFTGHPYF